MVGVLLVVGIHLGIILPLWSHAPRPDAPKTAVPLMVNLIQQETPAPSPPKPEIERQKRPTSLPVKRELPQPRMESPIIRDQTTAPATVATQRSEPKPASTVDAPVAPSAPPAPPAPPVPPNFNADYLHNAAPVYPALSRRLGEQGQVLVSVFVEVDGAPLKVELRSSSGSDRLDQSALDAVRRWKFVPAKQAGKPVAAWVVVPVVFSLKG